MTSWEFSGRRRLLLYTGEDGICLADCFSHQKYFPEKRMVPLWSVATLLGLNSFVYLLILKNIPLEASVFKLKLCGLDFIIHSADSDLVEHIQHMLIFLQIE